MPRDATYGWVIASIADIRGRHHHAEGYLGQWGTRGLDRALER